MGKVYVTKYFDFEACHHLQGYDGDCSRLHGHSYKMQVTVSRYIETQLKKQMKTCYDMMVIDFKELKRIVKEYIIDKVDHQNLDGIYTFTTAEFMCVEMFRLIEKNLPSNVKLESVKLWETAESFAEYKGE